MGETESLLLVILSTFLIVNGLIHAYFQMKLLIDTKRIDRLIAESAKNYRRTKSKQAAKPAGPRGSSGEEGDERGDESRYEAHPQAESAGALAEDDATVSAELNVDKALGREDKVAPAVRRAENKNAVALEIFVNRLGADAESVGPQRSIGFADSEGKPAAGGGEAKETVSYVVRIDCRELVRLIRMATGQWGYSPYEW